MVFLLHLLTENLQLMGKFFGIEFELVRFLSLHILNCLFQMELSINRFTFLGGGGGWVGGSPAGNKSICAASHK